MRSQGIVGKHQVVLAGFQRYEAAQHAVDVLARHKFPVEHLTIVGTGLRLQERVLGRLTLGKALVAGAATGGWIGLLIGLVFWIVTPWTLSPLASGILLGILIGVIWAAVAYAIRRRNFASVPLVIADPGRRGVRRTGPPDSRRPPTCSEQTQPRREHSFE